MNKSIKAIVVAGAVAVSSLVLALPASAHVTTKPLGPIVKGGYGTWAFSVPNESTTNSPTLKLEVKFPSDTPLASVRAQTKPGWTIETTTRKLDPPLTNDDGDQMTEAVDVMTWSGGQIAPGQFDLFWVSGGPLPVDSDKLVFEAIQTDADGTETAWTSPLIDGQAEPSHPTPILAIDNPPSSDANAAATSTTVASSNDQASAVTKSDLDDKASNSSAIGGLVLGALGLVIALVAIVFSRKTK